MSYLITTISCIVTKVLSDAIEQEIEIKSCSDWEATRKTVLFADNIIAYIENLMGSAKENYKNL